MKRKLFFLLCLCIGMFLLNESSNQRVEAFAPPTCGSTCDESFYNCNLTTTNNYNACIQAASTGTEYNGQSVTSGDCQTFATQSDQVCFNNYRTCLSTCFIGGSSGGGGRGGGRGRNACDTACQTDAFDCIDSNGSNCGTQYHSCIGNC